MIRRTRLRVQMLALQCELEEKCMEWKHKKYRKKKRVWCRSWITRRDMLGMSNQLMRELAEEEPKDYQNTIRLTREQFEYLLQLTESYIQRKNTRMRMAIPAKAKLELTLRFLAGGESFKFLSTAFRIPVTSISLFLPEVLVAIRKALAPYLKAPSTEEEWKTVAKKFHQYSNFPRCCGALDGKHVMIKRPPRSGAEFFCYKGFYSIVMLALVDSDYCFLFLDVGANGRAGDAGIFRDSSLCTALENNLFNFPPDHVILGDDAFPLKPYLMKRYPENTKSIEEKIFNYRQSRARDKVENAFGILASRFRIFLRTNELKPTTVDKVIWAACSLHNWLRRTSTKQYRYMSPTDVDQENLDTGEIIPGLWRSVTTGLSSIDSVGSHNYKREAEDIRRTYAKYFCTDGAVPWQWKRIGLEEDYEYEEENVDDDLMTLDELNAI